MLYTETIGTSANGTEIVTKSNFSIHSKQIRPLTLVIAGMHGDERAPVPMVESFIFRYLDAGNSLYICGPWIAGILHKDIGTPEAKAFLQDYLHARFIAGNNTNQQLIG